jgi:uncharacterized membrane protein YraQ (UPF0718 family)
MQNTRLNNLIEVILTRLNQWLKNPWRRFSLIIIGFLLGFFIGPVMMTSAGQKAELDIIGAGLMVLFVELCSRLIYRFKEKNIFLLSVLNSVKIGIMYSLFFEAFKLGS